MSELPPSILSGHIRRVYEETGLQNAPSDNQVKFLHYFAKVHCGLSNYLISIDLHKKKITFRVYDMEGQEVFVKYKDTWRLDELAVHLQLEGFTIRFYSRELPNTRN